MRPCCLVPLCLLLLSVQPFAQRLRRLTSRLRCLHAHDAIYLLCNCLAIPKLLYLLRTSPSWKARSELEEFDEIVRLSLQSISNVKMNLFGPRQHYQRQRVVSALGDRLTVLFLHSSLRCMPLKAWYPLFYPLGNQLLTHSYVRPRIFGRRLHNPQG